MAADTNIRGAVGNIGWLSFDKIIRMVGGLVVGVWVARYLGPTQFGTLNYARAFVGLFAAFATVGLNGLIVRDVVRFPESRGEILGSALAVRAASGFLAIVAIQVIAWLLRPDERVTRLVVAFVSLGTITRHADVLKPWFESQVSSKYTVIGENAAFLVSALLRVLLIVAGAELIWFAVVLAIEAVLSRVIMGGIFARRHAHLARFRVRLRTVQSQLREGWPLILSGIAVAVYMKIDQFMLGSMIGDEAVGVYAAAVRVSEVWYFVPMAIVASVMPRIIQLQLTNPQKYRARFQQLFSLLTLLSYGVIVGTMLVGPALILWMFGESYAEAGQVLVLHIWAALFVGLGVASGKWLVNEGKTRINGLRTAVGAVVNVILNLILIPTVGVVGAAIATVVAQAVATFLFHLAFADTRWLFIAQLKSLRLAGLRSI